MHPKRVENPDAKCPRVKCKDHQKLVEAAWAQGWWCYLQKNGHVLCVPPDGKSRAVPVPGTPGDHRSYLNTRAMLRRAGLDQGET